MEKDKITDCKVVILGGSSGSLDVLIKILPQLQAITFAIVIVLHRKGGEDTTLENLIAVKSTIPVQEVEDKIPVLPGNIYIAPSDYHLLFEKEHVISLDISEKVNFSRPSIDVAFESAAEVYGPSLTAILLSGANADGTEGFKVIKELGGVTIVQKPETALMPFMPQSAVTHAAPDYVLDVEEMLSFINKINT
jgi:two-component system chemotaxis response regulator CheB